MNETLVTVVGNVATRPDFRETASGSAVARFRIAVTARRWDRARESWVDGPTSFYTVCAWRNLAANVAASVTIGEPLVVHGRLRVREERRDVPESRGAPEPSGAKTGEGAGARWVSAEIDAVAVGHDLARGTAAFRRVSQAKPQLTGATAP